MSLDTRTLRQLEIELMERYELTHTPAGEHMGHKAAPGLVYRDSRPWQIGDPSNRIDWPTTARTGQLHIRQYYNEFSINTLIVCDYSDRLVWGGGEARLLKSDLGRAAADGLAQIVSWHKDKVGCLVGGSTTTTVPIASNSAKLVSQALLQAQASNDEVLPELLESATRYNRPWPTLIVVISDFLGEGWKKPMADLVNTRGREVIAIQVLDPWDLELPEELQGRQIVAGLNKRIGFGRRAAREREQYREITATQQADVVRTLTHPQVRHWQLNTSEDLVPQLVRLLDRRQRRSSRAS